MFLILIEGWLVGIAIAAPIGPVGLLCIRKTLEMGMKGAFVVGIGAALADAMFGAFAGFGLSAISSFLVHQLFYLKVLGGLLLIFLGYREYTSTMPSRGVKLEKKASLLFIVLTTFLLTFTNPLTLVSMFAILSALGGGHFTSYEIFIVALGILLGSMSWWLILGNIIHHSKKYVPEKVMNKIRKGSAILLVVLGIYAILSAIF